MKKHEAKNSLFQSIKLLIEEARQKVVRNVNSVIVSTHFEIGRMIIESEQKGNERAQYAEKIIVLLSIELTEEYGKGYSVSNLEYMRKFYLLYKNRISQPVARKLIIEDENERNF